MLLIVVLCAACVKPLAAKTPMDTLFYAQQQVKNRELFVLLPGIKDSPEDYAKQGFIEAVRSRALLIDLVAVDANLGYYTLGNLTERLRVDVIRRARGDGYKKIWLVGVSLGGLGSLIYAKKHPSDIDGILVLAPFLGSLELVDEIVKVGGLKHWDPDSSLSLEKEREVWAWLKRYQHPDDGLPPLYLGYGRDDVFARAAGLVAGVLPADHVYVIPGGHDWSTWRKLWNKALDARFFAK